jgi:hypothetical protein
VVPLTIIGLFGGEAGGWSVVQWWSTYIPCGTLGYQKNKTKNLLTSKPVGTNGIGSGEFMSGKGT